MCKPRSEGGTLEKKGVTEVVSSLDRDGKDVPHHLAMGTYVVIESDSAYAGQCFVEYNCLPDKSGTYAALYRPTHMIGLELGISVASAALRKEPTGAPVCFNSDVVATAKRALKKGEMLDGEGGFLRVGQAGAGRRVAGGGLSAARPRPQRQARSATSPRASRCGGPTWPSTPATTPSRCAARWRRRSPGRTVTVERSNPLLARP